MKAVLFDMDGTLLPMDQDVFTREYFGALTKKMSAFGYEPKQLIDAIWKGTAAMVQNDGSKSNFDAFWEVLCEIYGERIMNDVAHFDEFYNNEFVELKRFFGFDKRAGEIVKRLKDSGLKVVLASNPIFPAVAQMNRAKAAGVDADLFDCITSYENSHYCKPNPDYYREIFSRLGVSAEDCLMVGNDVDEDMIAREVGADVFLITGCVLNRNGKDIDAYPHGDFDSLSAYIDERKLTR